MEDKKITLQLRFGRRELTALGALAVLALGTAPLSTETLTLNTYYPSPYGVYSQVRTTGNALLAYNAGGVGVGTLNPSANVKLTVVGKEGVDSLAVGYAAPYPNPVAPIDIGGGAVNQLMWAGQGATLVNDQGGSIELGGNNGKANPGGTPYIDFHTQSGGAVDYNLRLMPTWDGAVGLHVLRIFGDGGSEDNGVIGLSCRMVGYAFGNTSSCPTGWTIYSFADAGGVMFNSPGGGAIGMPTSGQMLCCKFSTN